MSLYSMVEQYASLGVHRAGTRVDRDTVDWFCEELHSVGATVEVSRFDIDVYRSQSSVSFDGNEVPAIPLYYESVGYQKTTDIFRGVLDVKNYSAAFGELRALMRKANNTPCEALVIATRCANNSIYAINRKPVLGSGLPTMLVAGRLSEQIFDSEIEVELNATIAPGRSFNVTGALGASNQPSVVITTPLSGWFTCAGERGTGIAIALSLAQKLVEITPVKVVGTSAHELYYAGGWEYTKSVTQPPPLVIHVGSSVAASMNVPHEGFAELSSDLQMRTHLGRDGHHRMAHIMSTLGVSLESVAQPHSPTAWAGESSCWAHLGAPMVSLAGDFPLFHTPEDIPEKATTPSLIEQVNDVFGDAVLAVLR